MAHHGEPDLAQEPEPAASRPVDVARLRAVVVDASVMGDRGDLRLNTLRRLSDLAERDGRLAICVPEPVLWEWSEHAAREYRAASATLASAASKLEKAGVLAPNMPLTDDQVRAHVEQAVRRIRHVQVVTLHAEDALAALRDQVLVLGPGKRVSAQGDKRVKTGASDSAWIRAVHRHAGGDSSAYALLSPDGDVPRAYRSWGWPQPLTLRNVNDLTLALEGTAFPSLTPDIVGRLVRRVCTTEYDLAAFDLVDEGGIGRMAVREEDAQVVLALDKVAGLAALGYLNVVDRIGSVEGELFLLANVEVTAWVHNQVSERFEPQPSGIIECLIRTPILLSPDADWPEALDLSFADASYVHPNTGQWSTSEDAFQELVEALRSLPGCEELDWPDDAWEHDDEGGCRSARVLGAAGHELAVTADPDEIGGPWTAEVHHGGVVVTVSCALLDSDYFGETWTLKATADAARERALELHDPWAVAATLLPSFASPESQAR